MGKNKRRQLQYYDSYHNTVVMLDSCEEQDVYAWCIEAIGLNILKDFRY